MDKIGIGAVELGNPQSLNLYVYCENDPINASDPDGLDGNYYQTNVVFRGGGPFPTSKSGSGLGTALLGLLGLAGIGAAVFQQQKGGGMKAPTPILPPVSMIEVLKYWFSDYWDEPGDASNQIQHSQRDPLAQIVNPGTVGAKDEIVLLDTNVASYIIRGMTPTDFGIASHSSMRITSTVYNELKNTSGINVKGLGDALEYANIEIQDFDSKRFMAEAAKIRPLIPLGSLPKSNQKLSSNLGDYALLIEAKSLGRPIVTMNARDFNINAIGGGKLAQRVGVTIMDAKPKITPKLPRLSVITNAIFRAIK